MERLRSMIVPLQGCFSSLPGFEQDVLSLRAGLAGKAPHGRLGVANRLNTSVRQVRRAEQQGLRRLRGLAASGGCAAGGQGLGSVSVVNGIIGVAEITAVPRLIAFGDPAYQAAVQSRFAELGENPLAGLRSSSFFPAVGDSTGGSANWALQLLAVMLLVGLVGLIRVAPVAPRLRARLGARSKAGAVTRLPREAAGRTPAAKEHGAAPAGESDELAA